MSRGDTISLSRKLKIYTRISIEIQSIHTKSQKVKLLYSAFFLKILCFVKNLNKYRKRPVIAKS